jgi:pilus assembly protein Flp/PilA
LTGHPDCGIVLDPSDSATGPSVLFGKLRTPPPVRGTLEERRYRSTVKYYVAIMSFIDSLLNRDEEGQGLAEYALILALIAIVAILALIFLGQQVSKILSNVGNSV